jgi:hypothetical protein
MYRDKNILFVFFQNPIFLSPSFPVLELYYLSFARLHLFETFCFPSMVHQTIQPKNTTSSMHNNNNDIIYKFLWIIKVGKIHDLQVVFIVLLCKHLRAVTLKLCFVFQYTPPLLDPKINETIKKRLVELLSPYPNFYLVGSNSNFGIGRKGGSWRTGEAGEDLLQTSTSSSLRHDPIIYTGSIPLLYFAHRMREERIVLETRLDADDGLPESYLETIQQTAWLEWGYDRPITSSKSNHTYDNNNHTAAKWLYWCVTNVLNWYPTVISMKNTTGGSKSSHDGKELSLLEEHIQVNRDPGSLFFSYDSTICYSPGLTFGLPVGEIYYPRVDHYNLLWQRNRFHCTSTEEVKKECIQPLPPTIYAFRSRTPTSAGFKDLVNISVSTTTTTSSSRTPRIRKNKAADQREQLVSLNVSGWDMVQQRYNISQRRAHETNVYLHRHLLLILQDNWIGQCSSGHSCKHKTKEELAYMIQSLPGGSKVYESLRKKKRKKKDLTH